MGLLWELNETEDIKSLEQCLALSEHSINISSHGYSFLKDKIPRHTIQATRVICGKKTVKTREILHIFLRLWATVHSKVVECAS